MLEALRDLIRAINSPLSTAERGAVLAFAAVDGIAFSVLALPYAVVKSADRADSFDPSFLEAYLRGGTNYGFWFGALALPVAVTWIALSREEERKRSRTFELVRTLFVACALLLLLALATIVVGPDAHGGYVIRWNDAGQFGRALLSCTIPAVLLCSVLRPLAKWWFSDPIQPKKNA